MELRVPEDLTDEQAKKAAADWATCMAQVILSDKDAPVEYAMEGSGITEEQWDAITPNSGGVGGCMSCTSARIMGASSTDDFVNKCVICTVDREGFPQLVYVKVRLTQEQFDEGKHLKACKEYVDDLHAVVFDSADELEEFDNEYSAAVWSKSVTIDITANE